MVMALKLKTAWVFPGQGSQFPGMLSSYEHNDGVRALFQEASEVLECDIWKIAQTNPDNLLNQTAITQPVLLTAGVALWNEFQRVNSATPNRPLVFAGHSLGEYTALVCSGVLAFKEAVGLVFQRGKAMQEAVPEGQGAMAAVIGLSPDVIESLCKEVVDTDHKIVSAANLNSPEQIVIAGESSAVDKVMELAKQAGAKLVKKLDVSVPSHCLLMKPAADKMKIALEQCTWQLPRIPVIQNADACVHQDISTIKDALVRQLYSPVRWVESIRYLVSHYRPEQIIECGPGKVLTGLNKRIFNNKETESLTFEEINHDI